MSDSDVIVLGVIVVGLLTSFIIAKWLLKLLGSVLVTAGIVIMLAFLTTFSGFNSVTNNIFVESRILENIRTSVFQGSFGKLAETKIAPRVPAV